MNQLEKLAAAIVDGTTGDTEPIRKILVYASIDLANDWRANRESDPVYARARRENSDLLLELIDAIKKTEPQR